LAALAALQSAAALSAAEDGVTPEKDKAFDKFKKCAALAVAGSGASAHEARTALRMAAIELIRIAF